jgi:hypothetical protein
MTLLGNPLVLRAIGFLAVLAGVILFFLAVYGHGYDQAVGDIERKNYKSLQDAGAAGQKASNCPPEHWNREKQSCASSP